MDHPIELAMLGAAPGSRGCVAAVIETYRLQGLFRRRAIHYVATRSGAGALDEVRTSAAALRRFAGLLVEHRRLVVHAHCEAGPGFWREAAFLGLAEAARCPLLVHLHGGGFERFHDESAPPARALMRRLFERAASVIAASESRRAWVQRIAPRARVVCVPHPVSVSPEEPAAERPAMILFLGRLAPERGILDLVDAVATLRREIPELKLVCAGEGDRAGVARYAERLGIGEAVKFTGRVGPSGKRALLENAAAFALPCYAADLPLSLLEAMAAGVPSVASAVGAIPEAIVDGASGLLVAPGDRGALARALRKLLADRALGRRLGAAARETARLRFSPERVVPRLEEIYSDAGIVATGAPFRVGRIA